MDAAAHDRNPRRCHLMPRDAWLRGTPFAAGRSMSLDAHRRGMLDATGRSTSWNSWCLGTLDASRRWTPLNAWCQLTLAAAFRSMPRDDWRCRILNVSERSMVGDARYQGTHDAEGWLILWNAWRRRTIASERRLRRGMLDTAGCLTPRDARRCETFDVAGYSSLRGSRRPWKFNVTERSDAAGRLTSRETWRSTKTLHTLGRSNEAAGRK